MRESKSPTQPVLPSPIPTHILNVGDSVIGTAADDASVSVCEL
jgi:hypothetical protein